MAGGKFRKAKWMWESAAGSEADAIRAEYGVGRDMAAAIQEQAPCDTDPEVQAFLGGIEQQLAQSVRNKLHRFRVTAVAEEHPTAFALPGGFIFVARSLVELCDNNRDEMAFVVAHEMAHVIRRHAINRLLTQTALSAAALAAPGRGSLAPGFGRSASSGWNAPTLGSTSLKRTPLAPFSCARPASTRPARSACSNVSVDSTKPPTTWGWAPTSPPIPLSKTASNTCATALA